MLCNFRRERDAIVYKLLDETCEVAGVQCTREMEQRLLSGKREAGRFARVCSNHLAVWGDIDVAEALVQPELVAAEALHLFMAEEAALLDPFIKGWLNVRGRPTWTEEVLLHTLDLVVCRMIATAVIEQLSLPLAA